MGNRIWHTVASLKKRMASRSLSLSAAYGELHPQLHNAPASVLLHFLSHQSQAVATGEAMRELARFAAQLDDPKYNKRVPYSVLRKFTHLTDDHAWNYELHPTKGWRKELVR
jgi:hypothetical protein